MPDTHDNNICAQKLNRNRIFFNRCRFSWTLAFNDLNARQRTVVLLEPEERKKDHPCRGVRKPKLVIDQWFQCNVQHGCLEKSGSTLSEAISSLGCRRNSSSGSMLIRQLTELQLMASSRSVEPAGISVNSVGYHRSPLSQCTSCTWLRCIHLSERKIAWVSFIWTPEFSLHLFNPFNWISTETCLRWWYTVGWAIFSESVWLILRLCEPVEAKLICL